MIEQDPVALKIFKKETMSLFALNAAYQEFNIMKRIDHDNILKVKGFYEDNEHMVIIYELMSSDLRSLLVELDA